ncbi:MAG: hypothetical protein QOJ65_1315 [Fimbriimonadaceae bacterium]|jgi:hypothetical protein|nr:hypothetical protein [Fimbriimonadaceae bacterium]
MLTAIVAVVAFTQAQDQPALKPSILVSKMFARYAKANTLVGKIEYTQTAEAQATQTGQQLKNALHGTTDVQYERPSKLYVKQVFEGAPRPAYRIVSDGSRFVYNIPAGSTPTFLGSEPSSELLEPVNQKGFALTIGEIYQVGALGLYMKPAPLDVAIANNGDLRLFQSQLATLEDKGEETIDGMHARLVGGEWRSYKEATPSGGYQMAISDTGDLLRHVLKEKIADPTGQTAGVMVTTVWRVNLKVNATPDPALFKR